MQPKSDWSLYMHLKPLPLPLRPPSLSLSGLPPSPSLLPPSSYPSLLPLSSLSPSPYPSPPPLSLASEESAAELKKAILAKVGTITDVVACIGEWWMKGPILDQTLEEYRRVRSLTQS